MKLYLQNISIKGAWLTIHRGYESAWKTLGFDVEGYDNIEDLTTTDMPSEYDMMVREWELASMDDLEILSNARRVYLFAQPNYFVPPWGTHINFVSSLDDTKIGALNSMPNVKLWNFGDELSKTYFFKWKKVNSVPLAFDSINYVSAPSDEYEFDICYVGGSANNGFNEKEKILLKHWEEIDKLDIKKGFFINKDVSHAQENLLLFNSKIALNIHDAYQRILGNDTNERTFKSLGLGGFVISDEVEALKKLFPMMPMANTPKKMADLIMHFLDEDLSEIKEENRLNILKKHTYINRTQKLLDL